MNAHLVIIHGWIKLIFIWAGLNCIHWDLIGFLHVRLLYYWLIFFTTPTRSLLHQQKRNIVSEAKQVITLQNSTKTNICFLQYIIQVFESLVIWNESVAGTFPKSTLTEYTFFNIQCIQYIWIYSTNIIDIQHRKLE